MTRQELAQAACKGKTSLFYTDDPADHHTRQQALDICHKCPVMRQCRTAHINEPLGIFGGLTANQRRKIRQQQPTAASDAA